MHSLRVTSMTGALYVYSAMHTPATPQLSPAEFRVLADLAAEWSRLLAGRQPHFRQKKITSKTSHDPNVLSSSTWNQSTIIGKVHANFPGLENNLDLSKDFLVVFAETCPGRLQSSSAS